jgi:hypothetical protein
MLQKMAKSLALPSPRRLYVIGDNPESDILGANLYDRYLRRGGKGRFDHIDLSSFEVTVRQRQCDSCVPYRVRIAFGTGPER